jgi:anaphase-promoting complex subunit 2
MISSVPLNASRRRVFSSVFSPGSLQARPISATGSDHDQTQLASFQSTASSSTVKTGSFVSPQQERFTDAPRDQEKWDQAWSAATTFLAVPDQGFAPIYDARETDGSEALKDWNRLSPPSKETAEALSYLTAAAQQGTTAYGGTNSKDLIAWYGYEIRRHFLTNLRSGLYEVRLIICLHTAIGTNGSTAIETPGKRRSAPDNR